MAKVREMRAVVPRPLSLELGGPMAVLELPEIPLLLDDAEALLPWLLALASALWCRRRGFGSCVAWWHQVGTQGRQLSTSMSAAGEYTGFVPDMQCPGEEGRCSFF